jgi:L-serine dehydratase
MKTSIFDLFKIGIGPSSSHTVGPMRAAAAFVSRVAGSGKLPDVARLKAELYGSLALTGIGHATDRALLLGLSGAKPDTVDPDSVEPLVTSVRGTQILRLEGECDVPFDFDADIVFHRDMVLPGHPNAVRFTAWNSAGGVLQRETYYSTGGGFIRREGEATETPDARAAAPFPFRSADELLEHGELHHLPIWKMMLENEKVLRPEEEIFDRIRRIWETMEACMDRGLRTEGILPGGLKVRRRAPRLAAKLRHTPAGDQLAPMDWVNVWAMAVNEENAAGGRVVTAPTNGAAGIIPAIGKYYLTFVPGANEDGLFRFFLTAGAIGILYKENASISGAEVGCQGEVGVACSMAAGGLTAALGGSNREVECAAEIGMEHNLGMTCDPIGGLVQIPCIERNAMGSVKAVNASRIAMRESGDHKVSLDQVIHTMFETGKDMQSRYKETSLAGLAVNAVEC